MERKVIPGGLYRHYKDRWYFVIGESTHTETGEVFVTYFPLYRSLPALFIRPRDMFLEKIGDEAALLQEWRFLESDACRISRREKVELLEKARGLLRMMGLTIVEE